MKKGQNGFTLIELLVVIAIIAILAAILFPVFSQAKQAAAKAACTNYLQELGKAQLMYRDDFDDRLPLHIAWMGQFADGDYSTYYFLLTKYTKTKTGSFLCPSTITNVRIVNKDGREEFEQAPGPGRYPCACSGIFMALAAGQDLTERYNYPHQNSNDVTSYAAKLYPPNPTAPKSEWDAQCFKVSSEYKHPTKIVYLFEAIYDFIVGDSQFMNAAEEGGYLAPRHGDSANMLFYDGHVDSLSRQYIKDHAGMLLGYDDK